jgi:hypothetical protein
MYRIEALEDTVKIYSLNPCNIREYHRLEQGEDRYLNTLTLGKGWHTRMIKSSVAYTNCPLSLRRLMEQRRRWNNSTLENNFTALGLGFLWRSAPLYMFSLVIDNFGTLIYPAIFITLFGNTLAIAVPLITGWNIDYVRYASYGMLTIFMLVQIILFLLPISSRRLVGFFRFSVFFYSVIIIAIAGFVVLPFVLPAEYRRAPLVLPGIPTFVADRLGGDLFQEAYALLTLGLLRILLGITLLFYAMVMVFSAVRFRGKKALWISLIGGTAFAFFSPTWFFTFLWFTLCRYDSTSWR